MTVPFSPIDAGIVALVGVAVWSGYRSGFLATTYGLASWIVSFAAAVAFQSEAASLIERFGLLPALARPVAFVAVLVVVEALASLAGYVALTRVVRTLHRSEWARTADQALGPFPSVARSLFVVGIVLAALVVSPVSTELKAAVEMSRFGRALIERVSTIQPQLAVLSGQLGEEVPLFVTKLGAADSEDLSAVIPDDVRTEVDPVAERQLFDLVNEERVNAGLSALVWDDRLVPVARAHSEEMFRLKYFAHQSPTAGSPFDRLKAAGIAYTRAGENLAYAQSVAVAHRGLMSSEGHRANILSPQFTRFAVGAVSGGPYGRIFTQLFLTP